MKKLYATIKNLPFYLLILITMGVSAFEKLSELKAPEWFVKQFSGSIINLFPNALSVMWIMIMILQFLAFLFILLAIFRREFQDNKSKKWSQPAFLVTEITFIVLGFGQRITHQYEASFWLFAYAVLTFLAANTVLKSTEGGYKKSNI